MSARLASAKPAKRPSLAQLARTGLCRDEVAKARFHGVTRTVLASLADQLSIARYKLYSHPQTPDLGGEVILESAQFWLRVTATPPSVGREVIYAVTGDVDEQARAILHSTSLDVFDTPDDLVRRIQALLPRAQTPSCSSEPFTPAAANVPVHAVHLTKGSHCHA